MHEMSYCDCGREIHFPAGAAYGHQWRCWRCGRKWILTTTRPRPKTKATYAVASKQRRTPRPERPTVIVVTTRPERNGGGRQVRALPTPEPRRPNRTNLGTIGAIVGGVIFALIQVFSH
jgi:hypothetical protein